MTLSFDFWRPAAVLICLTTTALNGLAASNNEPGAHVFADGAVHRIKVEVDPAALPELRRDPRKYVPAVIVEGTNRYERVGIHLKGARGSFRGIDDKPSFTLAFDKFVPDLRFHGLRKVSFNNSVEDGAYMNELLGGELMRAAGVPAARAAHAMVELNGRRLGLYVVKEGFTEDLLGMHFRRTNGRLYEPGTGHDVDEALEEKSGASERTELDDLAVAAGEPDWLRRWAQFHQVLDCERFLSFMAMEVMIGHRDGYCLARNNFRIYHDPETSRVVFMPHGMDQLFGKADASIRPLMNGLVARTMMEIPEGRRAYRERLETFYTNLFVPGKINARIDAVAQQVRPALMPKEAAAFDTEIASLKQRIAARHAYLARQLADPDLKPLVFENGVARLTGWRMVDPPAGGKLDEAKAPDGKPALRIVSGPTTSASWRARVLLPAGRYRFEGAVRTARVQKMNFGKNHGATLRVTGVSTGERETLLGDTGWKTLSVTFDVTAREQEVECVCELRSRGGEAWFDAGSLRLVQVTGRQ